LQEIVAAGNPSARIIGHAEVGEPGIRVSA